MQLTKIPMTLLKAWREIIWVTATLAVYVMVVPTIGAYSISWAMQLGLTQWAWNTLGGSATVWITILLPWMPSLLLQLLIGTVLGITRRGSLRLPILVATCAFVGSLPLPIIAYMMAGRIHDFVCALILIPVTPIAAWLTAKCIRRCSPKPGHCNTCGYNLTGNISGRCPECGKEISNLGRVAASEG